MNTVLEDKLNILPDQPGVYIMKDKFGNIIYIGKAVSLKNRVRQYFNGSKNHSPKVKAMVCNIRDFEYIITDSELEALILECNLIKKHMPKYNVLLKDDKNYPYIKVTVNEPYPRLLLIRRVEDDGAKYFGPYTSMGAVKETMETVRKVFPIKTCNRKIDTKVANNARPCLNYYIKQCLAPCRGDVDREAYNRIIKEICLVLGGKHEKLQKQLEAEMEEAAAQLNFERAALLRDRIRALKVISEKQKIINSTLDDRDVIALAQGRHDSVVQMFFIRGGKLLGTQHMVLDDTASIDYQEIITSFIKQFYMDTLFIPREIILQRDIDEIQIIERWLSWKKGNRVYIRVPKRGDKKQILEMAVKNAMDLLNSISLRKEEEKSRTIGAVCKLQQYLNLDSPPLRIEAFDISNIQGTNAVGSMVVFVNGKPAKKHYRRFKIKTVDGPNDFASMGEVVLRRFRRGLDERERLEKEGKDVCDGKFSQFPDLIVIDGGKGQLTSALQSLEMLGLEYIPIIGLAKEFEEIYTIDSKEPIILPEDDNALHLLQRIRDEAHRFAITYHRSLRGKDIRRSVLDEITGVGVKRKKALLKAFNSIDEIKKATFQQLEKVDGIDKKTALNIYNYFNKSQ